MTKNFDRLDIPALADEILSLAWNQKKYTEYHFESLLFHLLLWDFQPFWKGREWHMSIKYLRVKIKKEWEDNKSLKEEMKENLQELYMLTRYRAIRGIGHENIPQECPYTFEQIMDESFFPV